MKKRFLALGLAGMMMLGAMAGCGGDNNSTPAPDTNEPSTNEPAGNGDEGMKIGLAIAVRDQYLTNMERATAPVAESMGIEFNVFDANQDISKQITDVQTAAGSGYDAMIVVLVNNDSAAEIMGAAGDMPVVFVNRMPTNTELLDGVTAAYVGSAEEDSGRMQGEYLAAYFAENNIENPNIVIFQGPLGQDSVMKRTQSAKDALTAAGVNYDIAMEDTAEWDRSKAMEKFTQFLGSGKDYDAVICNNDDMALGVIEAYTAMGVTEIPVPVLGIDATETGCDAIAAGTMAFTVFQNPVGQGVGALETAVALAKGEAPAGMEDGIVWVPFEPVDAGNVAEYQ